MSKKAWLLILTAGTLIAGISGYIVADVYDYLPGVLTQKPPEVGKPIPERAKVQLETLMPAQMRTDLPPLKNTDLLPLWEKLEAATGGSWNAGAYVIDATTGNVVFARNELTPVVPASTTKVYTAYLALTHLNSLETLKTRLYLEGDTLHLVGDGDLLLNPGKGEPKKIIGHAGIADLAQQAVTNLKETKHTAVQTPTKLVVHQLIHEGPSLDPALNYEHLNWISPQTSVAFDAGNLGGTYDKAPAQKVGATLAEHFRNTGLHLNLTYEDTPYKPQTPPLAEVKSAPISQITRLMLERSDNTLAEHLCRLSAQAATGHSTPQASYDFLTQEIKKLPIPHEGFTIRACSGLTEENQIAPQTTAEFLYLVYQNGTPAQKQLLRMNPVSATTGTLTNRLGAEAAGRVQAKTGLIDSASALSGILVTQSGRPLIFHVQSSGAAGAAYATRPHLDNFVTELVKR